MRTDADIIAANIARPVIGGSYLQPASCAKDIGREISVTIDHETLISDSADSPTFVISSLWHELQEGTSADEVIVAWYRRKHWDMAPIIVDEETLLEYEKQVAPEALLCMGYYAVSREEADARVGH